MEGEDISRIVLNWWPSCCFFCFPTELRYATARLTHDSHLSIACREGLRYVSRRFIGEGDRVEQMSRNGLVWGMASYVAGVHFSS